MDIDFYIVKFNNFGNYWNFNKDYFTKINSLLVDQ